MWRSGGLGVPADPVPVELPDGPISVEEVALLLPVIRQSLLASFDECHLRALFDIRYGWGYSSHPAAAGTIFHSFAAEAMRTMKALGETRIPVAEALEILYDVARQRNVPAWDRVVVPAHHWDKLRLGVIKFAKDNTFSVDRIVDIERRLTVPIRYDLPDGRIIERFFTGQPDLLLWDPPDGAIILDYKLSWGLPPARRDETGEPESAEKEARRLSPEGFFQQRAYGFVVLKRYPALQKVTLREFYPLKGVTRQATIYRHQMEHIERELAILIEGLDRAISEGPEFAGTGGPRDPWRASPGRGCQYCPKPSRCPIDSDARGAGAIESPEMAERYAAEYHVADRVRAHHRDALKAWANTHGPVPVKDSKGRRVMGFNRKDDGRNVFEVFTPDGSDRGPEGPDQKLAEAFAASSKEAAIERARKRRERRKT